MPRPKTDPDRNSILCQPWSMEWSSLWLKNRYLVNWMCSLRDGIISPSFCLFKFRISFPWGNKIEAETHSQKLFQWTLFNHQQLFGKEPQKKVNNSTVFLKLDNKNVFEYLYKRRRYQRAKKNIAFENNKLPFQ